MTQQTDADLNTLRADFAQLRADVAKMTGMLQQLLEHGRRQATTEAGAVIDRAEASLKQQAGEFAKRVEEQPLAAVATTFCIGLVLGLLFSGRRA